jgi:hypothetical protein
MKLPTFSTQFQKKPSKTNLMKIRPVGAELLHGYGQTDMTLILAFRNFAKAPKKVNVFVVLEHPKSQIAKIKM